MESSETELVVTRTFYVPAFLLFRAFTDPVQLAKWWGPHGFTNPLCEIDVRPGGALRINMRDSDGTLYPMTGTYHTIIKPELLVFTSSALDAKENPLFDVSNSFTFIEQSGKTKLIIHASVSNISDDAAPYIAGMETGWIQSLDRLAILMSGQMGRIKKIRFHIASLTPYLHSTLRIISSLMFILAGTSKLFAFPEGMPPDGSTAQFMTQIWIGGSLEAFGGTLLLLGLFTRPIAFLLAGEMAIAYFQFHFPAGYWPTLNGGVPAVLYCFLWLYFSAAGPGPWSIKLKNML